MMHKKLVQQVSEGDGLIAISPTQPYHIPQSYVLLVKATAQIVTKSRKLRLPRVNVSPSAGFSNRNPVAGEVNIRDPG